MSLSRLRITSLVFLLPLAACSTFEGFLDKGSRTEAAPVREAIFADAELPLADPISRNYFQLDDEAQSVIGELQVVRINEGDTFSDLAREYGLGYDEIVTANPTVDPWIPPAGTPVLLPTQYVLPATPRRGVVLNIASKRLFYFPEALEGEAQTVMTYPIGIGRVGWETPTGATTVTAKARDPHWYVPTSVRKEHAELGNPLPAIVPPGPDNPLGRHVLKLGLPGYLIHGTNQPYGVGMRVSHGCVRMYPENIETLYELVGLGLEVTIVNQPYLLGERDGEMYFESHPPLEEDELPAEERIAGLLAALAESDETFVADPELSAHMQAAASEARGVPVQLARGDLDEIFERAVLVHNTVELDPDVPTLSEVREMIDQLPDADPVIIEAIN
ncbi:MAG: L,D-transpeptidase family protein [Woeseia sp.]